MSESSSPPRRPRLSLQIKAISKGAGARKSRTLAASVDPSSPTSFNTLSNVYVTAIDRSTPVQQQEPVTAIRTKLVLQTPQDDGKERRHQSPYLGPYLDTPLTAQPLSPTVSRDVNFPSTMTATPPLSAGPADPNMARIFSFSPRDTAGPWAGIHVPPSPRTPQRRTTLPASLVKPPYTHPRCLHSILRNSPLPPLSTKSPLSPSRRSLRLQEKAAKRVAYNSPLEQTITTNKYVKSHVDLLSDDASPFSPNNAEEDPETVLDHTMAYTGNETRDGGQTPGPFEEMRRRMAGLGTSSLLSPVAAGVKKRKKEKKRRWVWTIGQDEEEDDVAIPKVAEKPAESPAPKPVVPVIAVPEPRPRRQKTARVISLGAPAAVAPPAPIEHIPTLAAEPSWPAEPPTPSVESTMSQDSVFDMSADVEMSDVSSMLSEVDGEAMLDPDMMELDVDTPVAASGALVMGSKWLDSVDLGLLGRGTNRDTPIPPDLVAA